MKALIFGKTGQVACELQRRMPEARFLDRAEADLADPQACVAAIFNNPADVVINAAAYTAVDLAEKQEALATTINGTSPRAMAEAAAARDIPFVHVSTDYVFDGSGTRPWQVDDATAPLGAYGRSKLAGEIGVAAADGRYGILRTSWVFSAHGANFVKTMLRLSETRDALNIVGDQIGGPTAAADIAAALETMARQFCEGQGQSGVYHFSGAPDVSWADFAKEIFRQADRQVTVTDIPSAEYPTPAQRPMNSRLDCALTETVFGITRPDWKQSLSQVLHELSETTQ